MSNKLSFIAAALLALGAVSCQKMYTAKTPDSVSLYTQSDSKAKSAEAGVQGVTICATAAWTATSNVDWISVTPSSGGKGMQEVVLTYTANTTGAQRQGGVTFSSSTNSETYVLTQDK